MVLLHIPELYASSSQVKHNDIFQKLKIALMFKQGPP